MEIKTNLKNLPEGRYTIEEGMIILLDQILTEIKSWKIKQAKPT